MIEFDEIRLSLNAMEEGIKELKESLNIVHVEEEIKKLEDDKGTDFSNALVPCFQVLGIIRRRRRKGADCRKVFGP